MWRKSSKDYRFRDFPTETGAFHRRAACLRAESLLFSESCNEALHERQQRVANESGLCYSQKVETKAVGLPVAREAAPRAKDAKFLRPSSEATFVGREEAKAAPDPCRKIPQRTIHRKTREIISRAPQWRRLRWSIIDILRSAKPIWTLFRSGLKRFRVRGVTVHSELERP